MDIFIAFFSFRKTSPGLELNQKRKRSHFIHGDPNASSLGTTAQRIEVTYVFLMMLNNIRLPFNNAITYWAFFFHPTVSPSSLHHNHYRWVTKACEGIYLPTLNSSWVGRSPWVHCCCCLRGKDRILTQHCHTGWDAVRRLVRRSQYYYH